MGAHDELKDFLAFDPSHTGENGLARGTRTWQLHVDDVPHSTWVHAHRHDTIGKERRFLDVVGDEHSRRPQPLYDVGEFLLQAAGG